MRSTLISAVAVTAMIALVGCSSDSGESASAVNADACTQFAGAHDELTELTKAGPVGGDVDAWTGEKDASIAKLGPIGEQATGTVQTGIQTLVQALPADSLELTEVDSESGLSLIHI